MQCKSAPLPKTIKKDKIFQLILLRKNLKNIYIFKVGETFETTKKQLGDFDECVRACSSSKDIELISQAIREYYPELYNSHTGGPSSYSFYNSVTIGGLVIVPIFLILPILAILPSDDAISFQVVTKKLSLLLFSTPKQ